MMAQEEIDRAQGDASKLKDKECPAHRAWCRIECGEAQRQELSSATMGGMALLAQRFPIRLQNRVNKTHYRSSKTNLSSGPGIS
jgi:hypothetical protein